ncbi:MAG: type II secretion system protein [Chloroflexota bacterium]|nr:type II secretion system protein [Chloroflexota bacterium]
MCSERGFTLVELLMVLGILAILIGVVVWPMGGIPGGARRTAAQQELRTVQSAMDSLMAEHDAVSVDAGPAGDPTNGLQLDKNITVTYWRVGSIDVPTGTEHCVSETCTLRLRTWTHGSYTWDSSGQVTQTGYGAPWPPP